MKCTCPKCHAQIELDLPEVTEAGTSAVCPACNARVTVHRESFGGRALRKSIEISCAPCGSELGSQMHCPTCGAQFPDYLVVSLGRKRARGASKMVKLKTSPFPHAAASTSQLPTHEMSMRAEAAPARPSVPSGAKNPKAIRIAICLLVVVALVAAGSVFYLKNKAEKAYAKNFVMATYCVQVGTDMSLKAGAKISAEWKAALDAGQPYRPRPSTEEERALDIINSKLISAQSNLTNAPEKYSQCNEKLAKISGVYTRLRTLVLSPGNSQQDFSDTSKKLDGEYKLAVKEFKAGLPAEMMDELINASRKYKGLRSLLQ